MRRIGIVLALATLAWWLYSAATYLVAGSAFRAAWFAASFALALAFVLWRRQHGGPPAH